MIRRIHLDAVGGVAGDMFVAALLDAHSGEADGAMAAIRAGGLPQSIDLRVEPHHDHTLTGTRFEVVLPVEDGGEDHTPFRDLRARLGDSDLPGGTCDRAQDIFARLAAAEGAVHGVDPEDVTFHEVGAWDSIADIVGAAHLIEQRGDARWSVSSLPMGAGTVKSAHGDLPLPAPAVVELLKGFALHDDGRKGERITPTGAAILAHLQPVQDGVHGPERLAESGIGFGTKVFPGISNVLRVLEFESAGAAIGEDQVAVLRFEVDDQSPEDLAAGLDNLRALDGVLDVLQTPVFGKKGRIAAQIQILARPDARETAIAACFSETTTLGLRWEISRRAILQREDAAGVKLVTRPGGVKTAKAEIDQVAAGDGGHAGRSARKRASEDAALDGKDSDD
ncbi:MAG TPA: LarC family nickel insertion protein [Alphaproteobacteria bacterium]|nr:LarC family nickel insertion protein [Alphaproteobacteria bacterium]